VTSDKSLQLITNLIYQVKGIHPKDICAQDSLINDIAMDSIELIDLFIRLEELGGSVPESSITSNLTVSDLAKLV